jgi:hypothetical protein
MNESTTQTRVMIMKDSISTVRRAQVDPASDDVGDIVPRAKSSSSMPFRNQKST